MTDRKQMTSSTKLATTLLNTKCSIDNNTPSKAAAKTKWNQHSQQNTEITYYNKTNNMEMRYPSKIL